MRKVLLVVALLLASCAAGDPPTTDDEQDDGGGPPQATLCNQVPEVRCTTAQACYMGACYPCGLAGQLACQAPVAQCSAGILAARCTGQTGIFACFAGIPDGFGGPGQPAFSGLIAGAGQWHYCRVVRPGTWPCPAVYVNASSLCMP